MQKTEFIEAFAQATSTSKKDAAAAVDTFLGIISDAVRPSRKDNGPKEVVFKGFGSFKLRKTAARTAKNPRTGEPIKVKAGYRVAFKASPVLTKSL